MKRFRAIVVGAGGISGEWFPALIAEKVRVVAVVDLNKQAAEARIAQFALDACEASDNLKDVLARHTADFLLDLTVPEAHCEVTCAALRTGLHVIGEKPMASSMAEARKMVRTAEESGRMYMVSQSRRFLPLHESVANAVRAGKIGTLTTVNCDFFLGAHFAGFRAEMPSPLILDMAIHHFDMARMFSGKDAVGVFAREFNPAGSWYKEGAAANCIFELSDGVQFCYRGSWCAEGFHTAWAGHWRLIGDKGSILYEHEAPPRMQVVAKRAGFTWPCRETVLPPSPRKKIRMHGGLCEMLTFLRTGKVPPTECHDNIKSFAMVHAAIKSSRANKWVAIGEEL